MRPVLMDEAGVEFTSFTSVAVVVGFNGDSERFVGENEGVFANTIESADDGEFVGAFHGEFVGGRQCCKWRE